MAEGGMVEGGMVEGGMVEGGMAEDMAVPCPYQNMGCCLSFEIDG